MRRSCLQQTRPAGIAKGERHKRGDHNDNQQPDCDTVCTGRSALSCGITVSDDAHGHSLHSQSYFATPVP